MSDYAAKKTNLQTRLATLKADAVRIQQKIADTEKAIAACDAKTAEPSKA